MDNDCDVYIFRYRNNFKLSEAQEAIDHIEEKLKQNFRRNRVNDSDQVFQIDNIENLEDNEIQVEVKMKKNNLLNFLPETFNPPPNKEIQLQCQSRASWDEAHFLIVSSRFSWYYKNKHGSLHITYVVLIL